MADAIWVAVSGNAGVVQNSSEAAPSVAEPGGNAYGRGRQYDLGTNLKDTPQHNFDRAAVFHFPMPTPFQFLTLTDASPAENETDCVSARLVAVALQANFVYCTLVWIDLWDRGNRFFTTLPEDATGVRPYQGALQLSGDLTDAWNVGVWQSGAFDIHRDNVLQFEPDMQHTLGGALGISVGVVPQGNAPEFGDFQDGGVVTFIQIAAQFRYQP